MRNLENELENKKINNSKLLNYGFTKENNNYIYKAKICNDKFEMIVNFSNTIKSSILIDLSSNEEYVLVDVKNSSGDFVGTVKEEYENILKDIIEKCTEPNIFKSKQAKEIIKYINDKYNDELEYLWQKFPNNAIWRNKDNNKWYGALLVINESKLGVESDKIIEIIDLRYEKEKIKQIIDNQKIYSGYHMNKDNWITIKLDDSIDTKIIFELIDNSYNLSLEK